MPRQRDRHNFGKSHQRSEHCKNPIFFGFATSEWIDAQHNIGNWGEHLGRQPPLPPKAPKASSVRTVRPPKPDGDGQLFQLRDQAIELPLNQRLNGFSAGKAKSIPTGGLFSLD